MSQLLSFAGFELRYHLRRPMTYVFMAAMFLLAFLFATTDAVRIGGVAGKVVINSPEGKAALGFVAGLMKDRLSAPEIDRPDSRRLQAQGAAGFYFDPPRRARSCGPSPAAAKVSIPRSRRWRRRR